MYTMLEPLIGYSTGLASNLVKGWRTGKGSVRRLIIVGCLINLVAFVVLVGGNVIYPEKIYPEQNNIVLILFAVLSILSFAIYLIISAYVENIEREKGENLIAQKEIKILENPNEPILTWDLARIKLESYINKNLNQVMSIFYLSVFVMLVGFGLIIYGSYMAFKDQNNFQPSIVVAISGIIVNFIGASFLVIYKSVMEQAREYVNVLERINAVGMSVQVIESISEDKSELKEQTKADLAKGLIALYSK